MKKLNYKPCLCVLNISSWVGYSPDAEHVYGKLKFIQQNTDDDYGLITIDNIEEWRPAGEEIQLRKKLTIEQAKIFDQKDGSGYSWRRAVELDKRATTDRFDSFDEINKVGVKKYKSLKLDCPFISLFEWEKFNETVIIQPTHSDKSN
jgi:hypothetical protein